LITGLRMINLNKNSFISLDKYKKNVKR
jgi:hypothetical protein